MAERSVPGFAWTIGLNEIVPDNENAVAADGTAVAKDEASMDAPADLLAAIESLRLQQLSEVRIPEALEELREIREQSEKSANDIMERAEALMDSSMDEAVAILEACAFQDIVGQRVGKVVSILENMESRLSGFIAETGVVDGAGAADDKELEAERRQKELILHGPQLTGDGVSQDEIDAILGA